MNQPSLTVTCRKLPRLQIAILGGDGRLPTKVERELPDHARLRHFASPHDGGTGDARDLEQAIQHGGVDQVWILARWNSHSVTRCIRRLCRRLGIPVKIIR